MRRSFTAVGAVILILGGLFGVPGAGAISAGGGPVDCAGLQAALTASTDGDVFTLDGICTGSFSLRNNTTVTLEGDPTDGEDGFDGFNGEGNLGPLLTGLDNETTILRDLVFRNGDNGEGGGGAVSLFGNVAPTIDDVTFENNQATGDGGALWVNNTGESSAGSTTITGSTFTGNSADGNGGGAYVSNWPDLTVTGSTFTDNSASATESVGPQQPGGGGLYLQLLGDSGGTETFQAAVVTDADATITGSTFMGNAASGNGGGLHVVTFAPDSTIALTGNTVGEDARGSGNSADVLGGGIYAQSPGLLGLDDNDVVGNFSIEGGGGAFVHLALDFDGTVGASLEATGNLFEVNGTPGSGGGMSLFMSELSDAALSGNTFSDNHLVSADSEAEFGNGHFGGGLFVDMFFCEGPCGPVQVESRAAAVDESTAPLVQTGNTFEGNQVETAPFACGEGCALAEVGGGGEWINSVTTFSRHDRFLDNVVTGDTGGAEGGGVGIEGNFNQGTEMRMENAVVAGNSIDQAGSGGGIYVGFSCGEGDPGLCGTDLELVNTTVTDNSATLPSIAPGIGGGGEESPDDTLTMVNSIVAGNHSTGEGTGEPDIGGFSQVTSTYSDACTGAGFTGTAYEGTGNICADPGLIDIFHQTSSSPTVDVGSNAAVPAALTEDADGEARIQNGDSDGAAVVDMGADELAADVPKETTPDPKPDPVPGDGVTPPGSIGENDGYCLVAEDTGVFAFGNCGFAGTAKATSGTVNAPRGTTLNAPITGIAMTPDNKGYWMVAGDGGVFAFGSAVFHGSLGGMALSHPVVGIAATPTGNGYWLVASNGAVFAFGDARSQGSAAALPLNKPIVAMAATPSGTGYWLVAEDGGVFAFGDAPFLGSMGGKPLNQPVNGIAVRPGALGYWLVATDGGVFSFGDAPFFGSFGGKPLNKPIVAMKSSATGNGYWLVATDGGVFAFGSAPFRGSMGSTQLNYPVVDMTG